MDGFAAALATGFWFGLLTAVGPCPMAANIAAVSYIGQTGGKRVVLTGVCYALGRASAYVALAALVVYGLLAIPDVSNFLQKNLNRLLGPVLILVGMFLLELLRWRSGSSTVSEETQRRLSRMGPAGAALLGGLFACAFCPISAALFFGSLIPLSIRHHSVLLLPTAYGIGTGLPVVVFAALLAAGTRAVGRVFNQVTRVERWVRYTTGAIFIAVGVYYSLTYVFGLTLFG